MPPHNESDLPSDLMDRFNAQCGILHEGLLQRMEEVSERAASNAIREILLTIGLDVGKPLDVQRDMAVMREVGRLAMDVEFRKDLEHAREWRIAMQSFRTVTIRTTIIAIVSAALGALWIGFQQILRSPH